MKLAIILCAIFAILSGMGYRFLYTAITNNVSEMYKIIMTGKSEVGGLCSLCRILMYVFAAVFVVLLLIYLL